MANLAYRSQFVSGYAGQAVVLRASISFGALGAPTLVSGTGMGIASVTRNSAGDLTIALTNSFYSLMGVNHAFKSGSSAPASPGLWIKADSVSSGASPSLEIVLNAAGTATDPASGEVLLLELVMNRSSTGN